jgi:dipeptidyl aminopeptidase/acylaminoacyl peptidase
MRRYVLSGLVRALVAWSVTLGVALAAPRPMTFDDQMKFRRLAVAVVSPDGKYLAYTQGVTDKAANRVQYDLWVMPVSGGEARQLTSGPRSVTDPCWSPDSQTIAFVSNRDGKAQIWTVRRDGGEPRKVTDFFTNVSGVLWTADGRHLIFVAEVYPECPGEDCNRRKYAAAEASKVKAKIADRLLYRHWDSFKEGRRTHIFVVPVEGGAAKDLTPGDYDAPPFSLGGRDYDVSPDGRELAFARNTDRDEAISTNNDIFIVPLDGGEPKRISISPGSDTHPRYSPDGKYLAWLSQERAMFESDKKQVILYERATGKLRRLSDKVDISFDELAWSPDSQTLFLTGDQRGQVPIFTLTLAGNDVRTLVEQGQNGNLSVAPDGKTLYFTQSTLTRPNEIFAVATTGGAPKQLTQVNEAFLQEIAFGKVEETWFTGADETRIHAFIVKPPQFTEGKKYPMILLIHGGPQGAWSNGWSFRWNAQLFAAPGYVVVMVNPRGSTGYGQRFTDEISGDWGGKVYVDLLKGVEHVIGLGYVDADRIGAAGGSYGGYMVNWMLGHNTDKRFKAFVSHAGVYNLTSMYGATEELWFTEWEFKGNPWDNPELYEKWSPHRFAKNFATPTLVIHGELDYRVPIGEGLQLFTALQRRGVPSRLLYFPDEGHWILKPQNSELWYKTVHEWFATYLKPETVQ